jgi:hypothetical protein
VIASSQIEMLWKANLPHQQSEHNFNRPAASVNKIAIEQVRIFLRRISIQFENV